MRNFVLFLLFQFAFFKANSQLNLTDKNYIDSIKKVIYKTKNDSLKVELLASWDGLIYTSDTELDKKINEQIIEICKRNKSKRKKHYSFFQKEYASSLNNLSLIAIEKSDMFLALDYLLESYKIAKEQKINKLESNVLNNIGMVYRNIGSNKKALEYYLRSSKLIKDSLEDANTYNNIGLCYSDMNDYANAFKYFDISLRFSKKTNNLLNEGNVITNIADIYFEQRNYKIAKTKYEEANEIYIKLQNKLGYSYSANKLAMCLYNLGDYQNAIKFSKISYKISKENNILANLKESSRNLYYCYKALKQKDDLIFYLEEYNKYYMQYQNDFEDDKIVKKQFEIEFEQKKIRADMNFEKKIEISKEKSKKQSLILYFTIGILIVVFLFLILIFNRFKITQKQKIIIEQQKHLVEEKNKAITDSITYAKRIQSAILPQPKLVKEYFKDSFILYKPKDIVAGDFYWFEVIDDLIFFAAADCTGHGVPGAMVSVVCHNALNRSVKEFNLKMPSDILDKTREIVISEFEKADEDVKDGMDISLCVLNKRNLSLNWSGAHNPIWILRNSEILEYKADKQPIGKFTFAKPFTNIEIQILEKDEIYISTDGFQDQFGGDKGKKFKASQLKEILIVNSQKTMSEKYSLLDQTFELWKGNLEQVDDVCLIGFKI